MTTTRCPACASAVREIVLWPPGPSDELPPPEDMLVDALPRLTGTVRITDLVTGDAIMTEPAPGQYRPHACTGAAR